MSSTVLVVGSGGREHSLGWKLAQSKWVSRVIVAPGNPGMPSEWERWPVTLADGPLAFESLAKRAVQEKVDLLVVGPDAPLADGIIDIFEAHGIRSFGPTAAAAQIEASKSFAKEVMNAAGVPTARHWIVNTEAEATAVIHSAEWTSPGWVIKEDGLALGKGVQVCASREEALAAVKGLREKRIIEEFLIGEEISWMAFCDGDRCALLEPARDYKRLLDHQKGPNTGGMGAISPIPHLFEKLGSRVEEGVFLPILQELKKRGRPFKGLLYAGLIYNVSQDQIWVLEFNARFGDPEAQVLLSRMNADLFQWCDAVARGRLTPLPRRVPFLPGFGVCLIAASAGYPQKSERGRPIQIEDEDLLSRGDSLFFAGVQQGSQGLETGGGRVLGVMGQGLTVDSARESAYFNLNKIRFEGMQFRTDIGT